MVVGDLNADRVRQSHDTDSPRMKMHAKVFLKFLYLGNLYTRRGIDLVKGHRRAHDGLDIVDLDAIVFQSVADSGVVPGQFLVGNLVAA